MIDLETTSIGVGAMTFDVEMARKFGWTESQIAECWSDISAIYRSHSRAVAFEKGYTRTCPVCECWTVPLPAPCHLCEEDRLAAAQRTPTR